MPDNAIDLSSLRPLPPAIVVAFDALAKAKDPSLDPKADRLLSAHAKQWAVAPARDPDWWDGFRAGHKAGRNERQIVQWFAPPVRTGRLTLLVFAIVAAAILAARTWG